MGKVVKVQHNQSGYVKEELEKLMDSGKKNKQELYSIVETKTGIPRPTIRRIAGDLRKDLTRKINILEMSVTTKKSDKNKDQEKKSDKNKDQDPFSFIPKKIRLHWEKLIRYDLIPIRCSICKNKICYIDGYCDGSLVCNTCRGNFPEEKKHK